MAQVFGQRAELAVKLVVLAIGLGALGLIAYAASGVRAELGLQRVVAQPIPFSHKHHVGDDGIDCRYCHTRVETHADAGLPSTRICLTCHAQLFTDAEVLAPLRRSAATGQPIPWVRVHALPDFVYFHHGIHVAKGVACRECHGRVDQMPLTWRVAPLQMQWCLDCHRDPRPHLHARDDVFAMTSVRRPPTDEVPLQGERRLTDCSTCHR